jgi:biopolymer transport protein ExbD
MAINPGNAKGPQALINVTPMIDVLLVLLIIFMATAPETPHGFSAAIPAPADPAADPEPESAVVLEIDGAGSYRLNTQLMTEAGLAVKLSQVFSRHASRVLFLKADAELEYALVSHAIDISKDAGVERVALMPQQN